MPNANEVIRLVMAEVRGLGKKQRNEVQNFNFRGIDAVMNTVGPALREAGGFIVPQLVSADYAQVTTAKGGFMNVARIVAKFEVHGSEGEPVVGQVAAEAFDSGDKATSKAMSVALRTFLLQLLCLPTDEPDPDSYSYEVAKPAKDWIKLAEDLEWKGDLEGLMNLYNEASKLKAPTATLEKVAEIGSRLRAKSATK